MINQIIKEDTIIYEANQYLLSNKGFIEEIEKTGIINKLKQGNKSSQTVVTYPPLDKMKHLSDEDFVTVPTSDLNTLYVHIPYCNGVCTYCNYARTATDENSENLNQYLDYLDKESGILRERMGGGKIPVESIYIGGGTPTLLSVQGHEKMFSILRRDFAINSETEFSLEGSPETITKEKVEVGVNYGVNRVSIGVESFDDDMLRMIKRRHDAHGVYKAMDQIREGGITDIDIDMIRGLPGSDINTFYKDITGIQKSEAPSVTSYQYVLKPNSMDSRNLRGIAYDKKRIMVDHVLFKVAMKRMGYFQHPIDWFVKSPENIYKHQVLKWEHGANQLVLGSSSYGFLNGVQFENFSKPKKYRKAIDQGKLPIRRAARLPQDELERRAFLFGIKTQVNKNKFEQRFGKEPKDTGFGKTIDMLVKAKALDFENGNYSISDLGNLFTIPIQEAFYSEVYNPPKVIEMFLSEMGERNPYGVM